MIGIIGLLTVLYMVSLATQDVIWAAKGKQSPRLKERARNRDAHAKGQLTTPGWRIGQAIGGYFADLAEDARTKAYDQRAKRRARRQAKRAVGPVLVGWDRQLGFTAACDRCGWTAGPYQIETEADRAAAAHAAIHKGDDAGEDENSSEEEKQEPEAEAPRPALTIIPGGRTDENETPSLPDGTTVIHHDDETYEPKPRWGWRCDQCGQDHNGFECPDDAQADAQQTPCTPNGGNTVNTDVSAESIRVALATATATADDHVTDLREVASTMETAAENYEAAQVSPTVVEHLREAAHHYRTAETAISQVHDALTAAASWEVLS